MQRALLFKILIIFALTLIICIPMGIIHSIIEDRTKFRDQAVESVGNDSVREQTITGPVLVINYSDEYDEVVPVEGDATGKSKLVTHTVPRYHLVFPNELNIEGTILTDRRYRGIHQVLVYGGQHQFSGDFLLPAMEDLPRGNPKSRLTLGRTSMSLGIEDVRGIKTIPKMDWNGKIVEFQQGPSLRAMAAGVHAPLETMSLQAPERVKFAFALTLEGIERQNFVPIGKNNKVTMKSNWPHPQFSGRFLPSPRNRVINEKGFSATWDISSLSTNAQQQLADLQAGVAQKDGRHAGLDRFSVGFIEPVNIYSMADRAIKYSMLFVALTFAAFFVFEMLKRLPIHPIQYLLVGLSLMVFFLLLVGLSEHIDFALAYLIASVGCILLIGFYLSFVLRDWRRGMAFGTGLTMLYGALYGLLISENNALVMGSILLFAVLAAVMVATRKVDWYQITKAE